MAEMMKPHKHAALIKAWADGAEIEFQKVEGSWVRTDNPMWAEDTSYRIRPSKLPNLVHKMYLGFNIPDVSLNVSLRPRDNMTLAEFIFDGGTGKLLDIRVG